MMDQIVHYFFPDIKVEERRKFILLSFIGFLVGSYWLFRLLKQTIFFKIAFPVSFGWDHQQGALFQPIAAFWSPFVLLSTVFIYSKLVDLVKKEQLFYIVCSFYGILFTIICGLLIVQETYGDSTLGKELLSTMGWVSYFSIESFGALMMSLFWSFTNSITDSESAKKGFPLIVTMIQVGAMLGSLLLLTSTHIGTVWPLVAIATVCVFSIAIAVAYFMKITPHNLLIGDAAAHATEQQSHEKFFEGLIKGFTLLITRPYLIGILIISTVYEVATQLIAYQMHCYASLCPEYASPAAFSWFEGMFGFIVHLFSFFLALLFATSIFKRLGTQVSLLVYPIIFALCIALLFVFFMYGQPTTRQLLWATFITMVIIKGISFAINNPLKEMMYIPTSKDAKFKSKEWINVFGRGIAKSTGARINNSYKYALTDLMIYGTFINFGLIGIWFAAALYVGKKNQELIRDGTIIE